MQNYNKNSELLFQHLISVNKVQKGLHLLIESKWIAIIVYKVTKYLGKWIYGKYYQIMKRKSYTKSKEIKSLNFWQMFWWKKYKIKILIDRLIYHFNFLINSTHLINQQIKVINQNLLNPQINTMSQWWNLQ